MIVANILPMEKKIAVVGALAEGMSIRAAERMTGVHRDTIMRLGVRVGHGCKRIMDGEMTELECREIQLDELWGFIGKKQRRVKVDDPPDLGDVWTFVAIDATTKVVPCYRVGKRTAHDANAFVADLSSRLKNRVQISTDGLRLYVDAIEASFGADVDYGQLIKTFATTANVSPESRYSPGDVVSSERQILMGDPMRRKISTSFVESQNLTVRMHCRRLTRLTNAFSKKLDHFKAAVGLHFGYYNYVKRHNTLKATPAMAAGVAGTFWSVAELIERAEG